MCSPKKKSRKQTNDSNKRGDYRKFDEFSNQMRDLLIESHAQEKSSLMLLQTMEAASEASSKI